MVAHARSSLGPRTATFAVRLLASCALGALPMLSACDRGETVTISGNVEGLDTLALRGDSLLARADRPPDDIFYTPPSRLADSIAAAASAATVSAASAPAPSGDAGRRPATRRNTTLSTASGNGTLDAPPAMGSLTGAEMSRRAQLRGDSIARAYAAQASGGSDGARSRADSVRGVVVLQGTADAPQVALQAGNTTMALSGMATRGLMRLAGNEIVVHGVKISPRDIVVADFVVRAAKGLPVLDGVIAPDGVLRLTDGSGLRRVSLPPEVRALVGTRVWVAMRGANPAAFGILATR
ncbi:MAG: hypothetical protein LCH84_18030 [Gemmatimonadetes bacterium]|nr:hypothetical protein [Gemmatimonadota bacterium]